MKKCMVLLKYLSLINLIIFSPSLSHESEYKPSESKLFTSRLFSSQPPQKFWGEFGVRLFNSPGNRRNVFVAGVARGAVAARLFSSTPSQKFWEKIESVKTSLGDPTIRAAAATIGAAALTTLGTTIVSHSLDKRGTFYSFLGEYNRYDNKKTKLMTACELEMINEADLFSHDKYLPSELRKRVKELNHGIINAKNLEYSITKLENNIWSWWINRSIKKDAAGLRKRVEKHRCDLQHILLINETLIQVQKRNFALTTNANTLIASLDEKLRSYYRDYYCNENNPSASTEELENFKEFLTKTINIKGIIHKQHAETLDDSKLIQDNLNKALKCYNTIIKDNPSSHQTARVYFNKGILLCGVLQKNDQAILNFKKANQLEPYVPLVMMFSALSEYYRAPLGKGVEENSSQGTETSPTRDSYEIEYLITEAERRDPKDFLIKLLYADLNLKLSLFEKNEKNKEGYYKKSKEALEKCEDQFKKFPRETPRDLNHYYYYFMAQSQVANGDWEEALKSLKNIKNYLTKDHKLSDQVNEYIERIKNILESKDNEESKDSKEKILKDFLPTYIHAPHESGISIDEELLKMMPEYDEPCDKKNIKGRIEELLGIEKLQGDKVTSMPETIFY